MRLTSDYDSTFHVKCVLVRLASDYDSTFHVKCVLVRLASDYDSTFHVKCVLVRLASDYDSIFHVKRVLVRLALQTPMVSDITGRACAAGVRLRQHFPRETISGRPRFGSPSAVTYRSGWNA